MKGSEVTHVCCNCSFLIGWTQKWDRRIESIGMQANAAMSFDHTNSNSKKNSIFLSTFKKEKKNRDIN